MNPSVVIAQLFLFEVWYIRHTWKNMKIALFLCLHNYRGSFCAVQAEGAIDVHADREGQSVSLLFL